MKKLIAFIGYSGSGKDYEAKEKFPFYKRINMSDTAKEIVYSQLGISENELSYEDMKFYTFWLPNAHFTGRMLMNGLTETINKYDEDFWFKIWQNKVINQDSGVVVTDVRYYSSLKYLFHSEFDTTIYFADYKSYRYNPQNGITEKLITDIKESINPIHLQDITEYIKTLI